MKRVKKKSIYIWDVAPTRKKNVNNFLLLNKMSDSEAKPVDAVKPAETEETEKEIDSTKKRTLENSESKKDKKKKKSRRRNYDDDLPKENKSDKEDEDDDEDEGDADDLGADEEADEDELLEIDESNIITGGRRTRGKVIDFKKASEELAKENGDVVEEEEEEEEEFKEPEATK